MRQDTPPGFPKFDPIDIVGRKLADEHKGDIDLSKLNRAFGNILGDIQALQGGAAGGGLLSVIQDVHSKRKQDMVEGATPGSLFLETDRGAIYIRRMTGTSNAWYWFAGIMYDTFANRPADLKSTDIGFLFHATDTYREYRWSGTAWVDLTEPRNLHDQFYNSRSSSINTVTIPSVPAGRYLAGFHVSTTTGGVGTIAWTVSWTSNGTVRTINVGPLTLTAAANSPQTYVLNVDASTNITYATTYVAPGAYEFTATLAKL